jgi:cytochrome oxidase Cu insertion factor (SCO1/SenC/PrrC family)
LQAIALARERVIAFDWIVIPIGGTMKSIGAFLACSAFAAALAAQQITPPKTHLKAGDEAPDFTLPDTANKSVKLSDFRGKKIVVVAFFPAAFTGG